MNFANAGLVGAPGQRRPDMERQLQSPAPESKTLQRCINDLVSLLALPAVWSGSEPSQIVQSLLDALLRMLSLDFAYARLKDPVRTELIEILRLDVSRTLYMSQQDIAGMLNEWFGGDGQKSFQPLRTRLGDRYISIFPVVLEHQGDIGTVLVGAEREDFPGQTESLLLSVATKQASIALREASLFVEQKRIADELERRVAERTEGLAAANEELRKEIAERKLKEEKLHLNEEALRMAHTQIAQREERWRSVFENSAVGVSLVDLNGRFIAANPMYQKMLGYTEEELKNLSFLDITHEDYLELNRALIGELLEGKRKQFQIEKQYRRKNGSLVWVRNNVSSVPITKWVPRFLMVLSEDITARKRTEEALQASERSVRLIVDSIPGLVVRMSAAGEVEVANRQILEYFGKRLEDMKNWTTSGIVHPEDLPRAIEIASNSFATGDPYEMEVRVRRFDGVYRWFQCRGLPLRDAEGRVLQWYALHMDIDDQKKIEERLRAIINTIPTKAWTTRPDGYCDFLNQVWLDYAGLTAEQAQGWGWAQAIHPDDRTKLVEEWQSCLASGTTVDTEARIRRFDSSYRWFLIRANPLRDESGDILKWYGTNIDIEDRKRGEEALHARELSWRQIVDNIPGLVATTGAMGEVEFLNRQTLEYFGKTSEELKNWALIEAVHPDDLPRVIAARKKSIEAGLIYEVEHRCRRADGLYRWFQVRGLPVRNTAGATTAWYLLLTDIDDRKKAEEALQSNERNLSLMINAIHTYIHVLRTDGSVLYVNQMVLDYTGLTLEDVQKEDYRARFFHPEDVERLREERREALSRPVPFENEQRVLGKDGRYRWFLVRYNPLLDEQGRIDRWYVAATDIEDRKRAEAQVEQAYLRLAEAQRVSKTGSFITDLLADDHDWSEEAFRVFEFDPAAKVTVQMIRDTVHPEDLPTFDAVIARGMTGADVDFVFRIVTARGAVKHVRGIARVMEQIAGRPSFIGALQDVTESKLAEEALNKTRSELAHVARVTTLNTLTASIAHEVNQPLTGIVSNASACLRWLAGDVPNIEEVREAISDIVRDGKRAGAVIARIRALTRRAEMSSEKLDLNETIGEVLAIVGDEAKRKRVTVRTQFANELFLVSGDRVQLQQVVLNLVMNAIEAMSSIGERPRELVITTWNINTDHVQAAVEDSGIGLDPNTREKIFDSFYTTKPSGMGMGLSICRSILQAHGGRLWATPKDGPGTSFHFILPRYHGEESNAAGAGA